MNRNHKIGMLTEFLEESEPMPERTLLVECFYQGFNSAVNANIRRLLRQSPRAEYCSPKDIVWILSDSKKHMFTFLSILDHLGIEHLAHDIRMKWYKVSNNLVRVGYRKRLHRVKDSFNQKKVGCDVL